MKLLLDDVLNNEIKDYLLSQDGINEVEIKNIDFRSEINIKYNNKISPLIIMKYIDLFEQNKYSTLLEFNKELNIKTKTLKYIVDDICCEYCYKELVMALFENKFINSVKSNFDFHKSAFDVELIIEYSNYTEEELREYIRKNI